MSTPTPPGPPTYGAPFWDARYANAAGFVFGTEPNDFLRSVADRIPPGPVLCLGEGEGRNAVFLARRGHAVTALDQSATGLAKAAALAAQHGVPLTTQMADLNDYTIAPGAWAAVIESRKAKKARFRRAGLVSESAVRAFSTESDADSAGSADWPGRPGLTGGAGA